MILSTDRSVGPLDTHPSLWFNGQLEAGGIDEHDTGVFGDELKTMGAVGYDFKEFHFLLFLIRFRSRKFFVRLA